MLEKSTKLRRFTDTNGFNCGQVIKHISKTMIEKSSSFFYYWEDGKLRGLMILKNGCSYDLYDYQLGNDDPDQLLRLSPAQAEEEIRERLNPEKETEEDTEKNSEIYGEQFRVVIWSNGSRSLYFNSTELTFEIIEQTREKREEMYISQILEGVEDVTLLDLPEQWPIYSETETAEFIQMNYIEYIKELTKW